MNQWYVFWTVGQILRWSHLWLEINQHTRFYLVYLVDIPWHAKMLRSAPFPWSFAYSHPVVFVNVWKAKMGRISSCLIWINSNSPRIPSGKHTKNYRKSPFSMGKSTISMAMFNSYVKNYQRVKQILETFPLPFRRRGVTPHVPWGSAETLLQISQLFAYAGVYRVYRTKHHFSVDTVMPKLHTQPLRFARKALPRTTTSQCMPASWACKRFYPKVFCKRGKKRAAGFRKPSNCNNKNIVNHTVAIYSNINVYIYIHIYILIIYSCSSGLIEHISYTAVIKWLRGNFSDFLSNHVSIKIPKVLAETNLHNINYKSSSIISGFALPSLIHNNQPLL